MKKMQEVKKTVGEYEAELSGKQEARERRIRRDRRRRALFAGLVFMICIPIVICMYLIIRVNAIDGRLDKLSNSLNIEAELDNPDTAAYAAETGKSDVDSPQPEKSTGADIVYLALSKESNDIRAEKQAGSDEEMAAEDVTTEEVTTEATTAETSGNYVPNGKKVYLTFDDGPSENTDDILDILKKNNVKATFFVVYNDDKSMVPYYNRIVDEGHTIGLHSYSHVYETVYASEKAFEEDVTKIHDYVQSVTGVDAKIYRFPGGSSNEVSENVDTNRMIEYLTREGYTYYDWNAESGDAEDEGLTPDQLNDNVMGYVRANEGDSVVLMHDFKNGVATARALQSLIDTLKAEGYELCPIDENTDPCQHVTIE